MERLQQVKKITIYDLATLAGTSASTVSAVLNGTWKKRRISQKLADRISRLALQKGYSVNMQASALRRERSGIIGMIVPMYDNRYFSSIAQTFEAMARQKGLFPIVTCTRRDPELELEAARSMLAYQVEYLVCTGATDPDRITDLCNAAGVPTINLDLPGRKAPSVISDNYAGALSLTKITLLKSSDEGLGAQPLLFVGGRGSDHNTRERVRGFRAAHAELGVAVDENYILTCGYAASKAEDSLESFAKREGQIPSGMFVNSTISLEGVIRWIKRFGKMYLREVKIGCFDWDPFAELLSENISMVRQDVPSMLNVVFSLIDNPSSQAEVIEIPPIIPSDSLDLIGN